MNLSAQNTGEPQVYVFVQSFNRKRLLEIATSSFQKVLEADTRFHMFVYDAGSTDGSLEYLKSLKDEHRVSLSIITNPSDLSFSAGHNRLIQEIGSGQAPTSLVLFYETDNAIKDRQAIDEAMETIRCGEADAVGFTPVKHDGTGVGYGGAFPNKKEFILGQRATKWLRKFRNAGASRNERIFETEVAFTSPLLVKLELLKRINGFDEVNFPFGHSDTDLCKRIRKAGGKILVLRSSSFVHDNLDNASTWSRNRVWDYHRATFKFLEKHDAPFSMVEKFFLFSRHSIEIFALMSAAPFSAIARRKLPGRTKLLLASLNGYQAGK